MSSSGVGLLGSICPSARSSRALQEVHAPERGRSVQREHHGKLRRGEFFQGSAPANRGAISRSIIEKADNHVEVALAILKSPFVGQSENISGHDRLAEK